MLLPLSPASLHAYGAYSLLRITVFTRGASAKSLNASHGRRYLHAKSRIPDTAAMRPKRAQQVFKAWAHVGCRWSGPLCSLACASWSSMASAIPSSLLPSTWPPMVRAFRCLPTPGHISCQACITPSGDCHYHRAALSSETTTLSESDCWMPAACQSRPCSPNCIPACVLWTPGGM